MSQLLTEKCRFWLPQHCHDKSLVIRFHCNYITLIYYWLALITKHKSGNKRRKTHVSKVNGVITPEKGTGHLQPFSWPPLSVIISVSHFQNPRADVPPSITNLEVRASIPGTLTAKETLLFPALEGSWSSADAKRGVTYQTTMYRRLGVSFNRTQRPNKQTNMTHSNSEYCDVKWNHCSNQQWR